MKQFKKYCVGMLLLATLLAATACGRANKDTPDNSGAGTAAGEGANSAAEEGTSIDDVLFDTDGDGVYDSADVDGDGLLEEIGRDANDVVDDLVNDVTGDDTLVDGETGDAISGDSSAGNPDGEAGTVLDQENMNGDVLP